MIHIVKNKREALAAIKDLKRLKILSADTETEGFDWKRQKICMLQLGNEKSQYLIDASRVDLKLFTDLLCNPDTKKILHNVLFDGTWLKWEHNIDIINLHDTQSAEKIMLGVVLPMKPPAGKTKPWLEAMKPMYSASLEHCLQRRGLDGKFEFEPFTYGESWTDGQIKYSARDIEPLEYLMEDQVRVINQLGLDNVLQLENNVAEVFYNMSCRGFHVDVKKWRDYAAEFKRSYDQSMHELSKFEDLNWGAPGQVCKFFGVKYIKELVALDETTLDKKKQQAYKHWANAREIKTIVSTFGESWLEKNAYKGKVHCSFTQIVNTGRCSSDHPNLQNLPVKRGERHREFLIPAKGSKFGVLDFSGQELAIMAIGSQEPEWLATLRAGKDLHQRCADLMTEVSGKLIERKLAKTLNFTMGYGGGKAVVADRAGISEDFAQELIWIYFRTFPKLKRYLDNNGKFAIQNGCTYSFEPFRRRRVLALEEEDWRKKNIGKNSPVQGTGADMTKLAMWYMHVSGLRLIHQLHDELVIEASNKDIAAHMEVAVECMNKACEQILGERLSAPDYHIQSHYGKA